ncbi:hypothetical protein K461DRAFT_282826 [Myriangium duriaei CBS 260.36]|uniref:Uncharacterized protein n=1 Tax=Myriangium duriaei CBS 260.36 TaxID=1168546 RepID=A0A9P4IV76_9PEZI|nr:hypothetical protein K461DRAFT_282826 [Myriangium duriaei CBS 260.36]
MASTSCPPARGTTRWDAIASICVRLWWRERRLHRPLLRRSSIRTPRLPYDFVWAFLVSLRELVSLITVVIPSCQLVFLVLVKACHVAGTQHVLRATHLHRHKAARIKHSSPCLVEETKGRTCAVAGVF